MSAVKSGLILLVALALLFLSAGSVEARESAWQDWGYVWKVLTLQSYNARLVILSTSLLGMASGLVGTFLLLRKRSLMGDVLSHAAYPGIGMAFLVMLLLGGEGKWLPGLLLGAAATGLLGVLMVLAIRNTTRLKDDAAMGIVMGVSFGLGVALMKMVSNLPQADAAGLNSFIYGTAASMIFGDFLLILVVTTGAALASLFLLKEFAILCFDESFAASQGWPTLFLDLAMLGLVTSVTVVGLQAVGLVLIIAFLIIPATAARFWTHDLRGMLALAAVIGGASGWIGSSLSALFCRFPHRGGNCSGCGRDFPGEHALRSGPWGWCPAHGATPGCGARSGGNTSCGRHTKYWRGSNPMLPSLSAISPSRSIPS